MAKKLSPERQMAGNTIKSMLLFLLAVSVAGGLIAYAITSPSLGYTSILVSIAAILLVIFGVFALRRYRDAKMGLPFEDERSRRIMEKAASKSFYVTLYVLLAIGIFSEGAIQFRDVSQATGTAVGIMALLWFAFWIYYGRMEI